MSQDPSASTGDKFILTFVLDDGTKLTQEAPTDAYLWDILARYQAKFKVNLLNKQNNNGAWTIPHATFGNIELTTVTDWHQTASQLNIDKFGNDEVLFQLDFVTSDIQIYETQSHITDLKSKLPRQRSVTANDIIDVSVANNDIDTVMQSNTNSANNNSNTNTNNNDSNNNGNNSDMFDNASRRPDVPSTTDSAGWERIYTEVEHRMGQIGRQLYNICKDIGDGGPKFATAQKTLRAVVSNLLKENSTERHRRLRLSNEKLINNLLQYSGSKEFLLIIGFNEDPSNSEFIVYPEKSLKTQEIRTLLDNALKQINGMRPIIKEKPIPKVERELKVYHSDELHKYRIAHSNLDSADSPGVTEMNSKSSMSEMKNNNDSNSESSISGVVNNQSKFNKKNNNPLTTYMQSRGVGSKSGGGSGGNRGSSNSGSGQKTKEISEERRAEMVALKMAMKDTARQNRLKNPDKLMSTEKRKELLGIKDRDYKLSLIQVEFPSKLVLEGKFHPREQISALAEYVHSALDPKLLQLCPEYKLFLPPREELKDFSKTFRQMSMIPACTVRFSADVPQSYEGRYLKEELCKDISHQYTQIQSESKDDDSKQNYNGNNNRNRNNNNQSNSNKSGGGGHKNPKREAALKKLLRFKK